MTNSDLKNTDAKVICVCGGYGFPFGNASAARIIMIGKALQQAGIAFQLLHCGPDPFAVNKDRSGVYEGIPFQYTTSVTRPQNAFLRFLLYFWGILVLTFRLARLRLTHASTLIYLYCMDGAMNLYLGVLCQLLRVPMVQEMCEWFPGDPNCSRFNQWLYKRRIFTAPTGMLVISAAIEERVQHTCATMNPSLLIHRVPTIVDAQRFAHAPVTGPSAERVATFVYCGTWLVDIFHVIRAFALVKPHGYACKLAIIGAYGESNAPAILGYAAAQGLPPEDILLTGYMDDSALESCYKSAAALLMPLWNDDRSLTRLPNKLGGYLASSRPLITSRIGDLTNYLVDDVNAYIGEPGNEQDFADRMLAVLHDPHRADQIGAAGQRVCFAQLDYRSHVTGLATFVVNCIQSYHGRAFLRRRSHEHCTVPTNAEDVIKQPRPS